MTDAPVDLNHLNELAGQLNAAMTAVTPYRLAIADPASLIPIDKNAHYMSKRVWDRLVENVKADHNLSSLPFCWQREDKQFVVLSGNHRVQAAAEAKIPAILILYTDAALSKAQQRAIQLAHNAIVGQDNPAILRELWQEIDDLSMKVYSGLDDAYLETLEQVELVSLKEDQLCFEELRILFLPSEIETLKDVLKRLGKATTPKTMLAARYEDFDRFFNALLDFKGAAEIVNSATAILAMTEIVEEWLAAHKQAEEAPA